MILDSIVYPGVREGLTTLTDHNCVLFQSISVQSLIYEAYSRYGFLSAGTIERLRLKHRLRVVQSLEDGISRNIVRSVVTDGYFSTEELQVSNKQIFVRKVD